MPEASSEDELTRARSEGFFFDGPFSRGDGFEALVRNWLAALDREPVGSGGKARLGAAYRSQLLVQIVGQALVEFGLVELGRARLPGSTSSAGSLVA